MTRRDVFPPLSFGQAFLFQKTAGNVTPPRRDPAGYRRFHPLLKQAALLGFALGFTGALLFQSLRQTATSLLSHRSQPNASFSAAALPR